MAFDAVHYRRISLRLAADGVTHGKRWTWHSSYGARCTGVSENLSTSFSSLIKRIIGGGSEQRDRCYAGGNMVSARTETRSRNEQFPIRRVALEAMSIQPLPLLSFSLDDAFDRHSSTRSLSSVGYTNWPSSASRTLLADDMQPPFIYPSPFRETMPARCGAVRCGAVCFVIDRRA